MRSRAIAIAVFIAGLAGCGAESGSVTPDATSADSPFVNCPANPTPPGGTCPAACTGGCLDGTCTIMCGPAGCSSTTITCPPDFACSLVCSGVDACDTSTVTCPAGYACSVTCDEYDSCGDLVLQCGSASCTIQCGATGGEACGGATVMCGTGGCQASCAGTQAPVLTCGSSCGCVPCM